LQRALANAEKERDQVTRKLSTESFLAKAPSAVVASVRDRLTAAEAEVERIHVALAALPE
jgi:valyl-tRNA synthetase